MRVDAIREFVDSGDRTWIDRGNDPRIEMMEERRMEERVRERIFGNNNHNLSAGVSPVRGSPTCNSGAQQQGRGGAGRGRGRRVR